MTPVEQQPGVGSGLSLVMQLAAARRLVGRTMGGPNADRRQVLDAFMAAEKWIGEREREIADLRNGVVVAPTEKRSTVVKVQIDDTMLNARVDSVIATHITKVMELMRDALVFAPRDGATP